MVERRLVCRRVCLRLLAGAARRRARALRIPHVRAVGGHRRPQHEAERPYRYPGRVPFARRRIALGRGPCRGLHLQQPVDWARRHGVPAKPHGGRRVRLHAPVGRIARATSRTYSRALEDDGLHWAFYSFREDAWDGMDYELGAAKLPWHYWDAVEQGKPYALAAGTEQGVRADLPAAASLERGYFEPRGANTSTESVTVRLSRGSSAPTPTTLRATSSPRSLRIETTTEYSHESAPAGLRNAPSTRSAENVGWARRFDDSNWDRIADDAGNPGRRWRSPGWLSCSADRSWSCRVPQHGRSWVTSVLGLLVPAEFRLATHARTGRHGERAGLQLAVEHAGLQ